LSELTDSTGEHVSLDKSLLELVHTDTFLIHDVFRRATGEQAREFVIKINQILSDTPSF
jgi:hypothetical protein